MVKKSSVLQALSAVDPNLFDKLHAQITPEEIHRYLKAVSETAAPFQTVADTRGRVIENLLQDDDLLSGAGIRFDRNYRGTGNTVLLAGREPKDKAIWLLAHLDTITYLTQPGRPERVPLQPICYHLMEPGQRPAVALEYDLDLGDYQKAATGVIEVQDPDAPPEFVPDEPQVVMPGTRVCFQTELNWERETGTISGSLDDAGGAVALLMAFKFLAQYGLEIMLGFTDEEEGPAGTGSQSFSRGGARLANLFDPPQLAIVSDIHEAASMYGGRGPSTFGIGDGASFAPYASNGVGSVTPGGLYRLLRALSDELSEMGIRLNENKDGYVSRSEDINALRRTPNVALLGFLGVNRHFQRGPEEANLNDLVDLAKAVVCCCLLTRSEYWPS